MSKLERTELLESLLVDSSQAEIHRTRSSRRPWIILTCINSLILIVTLALVASSFQLLQRLDGGDIRLHQSSRRPISHKHSATSPDEHLQTLGWLSCGNTTEQAVQNGCIFDLMLTSWVHPECYWHEHLTMTSEKANMTYFLDEEMTVPFHRAAEGIWPQHHIWAHPSYHALHCTYLWERQIMAWTSGDKIDSLSWNLEHTKHCAMTVLEKNSPYASKSTKLEQGFSDCGKP